MPHLEFNFHGLAVSGICWDDPRILARQREIAETAKSLAVFRDIAAFRVVTPKDLAAHHFGGSKREMWAGIKELKRQGLVKCRPHIDMRLHPSRIDVLALTPRGSAMAKRLSPDGSVYPAYATGERLLKRSELLHDIEVYPATQAAIERIERMGGVVDRILTDPELKREIAQEGNRAREGQRPNSALTLEQRKALADRLRLPVKGNQIQVPDAQIRYHIDDRELVQNIEVVTRSYSAAFISAKAAGGFSIHRVPAPQGHAGAAVRDRKRRG